MRRPRASFRRPAVLAAGALLVAAGAAANDKDLLYESQAAPPNILVVVSNTTTMANQPGTSRLDPLGQADGRNSKLGIAKTVLSSIVKNNPSKNWGISSFSYTAANFLPQGGATGSKHFIFQAAADSFPGKPYDRPAGTRVLFGKGSTSGQTFSAGGATYGVVQWQPAETVTSISPTGGGIATVPVSYDPASAPVAASDTEHLPFGGSDGARKMLLVNVEVPGRDASAEILFEILSSSPYAINGDSSETFTVRETLYKCAGGAAPCDPATANRVDGPVTTAYGIPPEYCRESDVNCDFPQVFGYGADAGREIGWTTLPVNSVPSGMQDWTHSSGNASGWLQQSNTNPQPVVMIPHDYAPWTPYSQSSPSSAVQSYAQRSIPCLAQALRPTAATVHPSGSSFVNRDDYPTFVPGQVSPDQNNACDRMIDGYYQTGSNLDQANPNASQTLILPIFPTINGNVAPLSGMLTNAFQYFNGGNSPGRCNAPVDGFCAGVRADDPFRNCRHDYIILVTDSFAAQLAAIGIKVYVVGFGLASGDAGQTNVCALPNGQPGNNGQCLAFWTGAETYNDDGSIHDHGYFTAGNATQLMEAMNEILNHLDTSSRDFATATIPSVSATSDGIAYFSEFNPRNNRSVWSGHLRAFLLDPATGDLQTTGAPKYLPLTTRYVFGDGSTPPSGSLVWEAGNTDRVTEQTASIVGNLDASGNGRIDPTALLTSSPGAGGTWSDATHDQAAGVVGRNVFFGLRPGDPGCASTTAECLVQVPAGVATGAALPDSGTLTGFEPAPPTPPATLPAWWATVRDSCLYARIPTPSGGCSSDPSPVPETGGDRDQALQNTFSFLRGDRDPVVESLKIAQNKFIDPATQQVTANCHSLQNDDDSPCYYGEVLGDIFHSNPVVVSFPADPTYYLAQDPGSAAPGTYGDRGSSYQTFFSDHARRRKILYAGADDGLLHAFDVGVFNGDSSSYADPATGQSVAPFQGKYDLGSGREIFAFAPRAGLNKAYHLAHSIEHTWTIDGPPTVADVYIDPGRAGAAPQGVAAGGAGADRDLSNGTGYAPQWRTVLVGTEREGGLPDWPDPMAAGTSGGGGSVFALDITDPDQAAHMKLSDSGGHRGVPECLVGSYDPSSPAAPSGCAGPYPRILWEIRDDTSVSSTVPTPTEKAATSEAAIQDLGMTWSQPVVGRVKVHDTASDTDRDFFVAIFGGGYGHSGSSTLLSDVNSGGHTGNFLYMVDVETGRILYKRNLGLWSSGAGAATTAGSLPAALPGQPAAIDADSNGYLDRVYIGDTQGRLWKVDLSAVPDFTSGRIAYSSWSPSLFFDEFAAAAPPSGAARQPIFNRPSVFLAGTTSGGAPRLGIAFGTGDRDNMPVSSDTRPNYLVVLVDDGTRTTPVNLSGLTAASLVANQCAAAGSCLRGSGYYVTLPTGSGGAQIVNTNTLVFDRTVIFNTFLHTSSPGDCNEVGQAFLYRIDASTGVSLYRDAQGDTVPNADAGTEVVSSPIAYYDKSGHVIGVGDRGGALELGKGKVPTVSIRSWKEQ
jgi:Tfp pilus tip-associated adhesin PilY1